MIIKYHRKFRKRLDKLEYRDKLRVYQAIEILKQNPFGAGLRGRALLGPLCSGLNRCPLWNITGSMCLRGCRCLAGQNLARFALLVFVLRFALFVRLRVKNVVILSRN